MRIIGIDPGLAITGWSIVDFDKDSKPEIIEYGCIYTEKGYSVSERLVEIYKDLNEILDKYTPDACGIETLLFTNNAKTAISVGEARGIVLLCMQSHLIPIHEFTPLQVKSSISGYGQAKKKQVQECVKLIFNLKELPKPDDAADALAISIACFDRMKMDHISDKMDI